MAQLEVPPDRREVSKCRAVDDPEPAIVAELEVPLDRRERPKRGAVDDLEPYGITRRAATG